MAIDKNTLKIWFQTGKKPTEDQFAAWMDSYWHKSEKINAENINGLNDLLAEKADKQYVLSLFDLIEAFDIEIQRLRTAVLYTEQNLSDEEIQQARKNLKLDFQFQDIDEIFKEELDNDELESED